MEAEWFLILLGAGHGGLLVLLTALFFSPLNFGVEGLRGRLRNIVGSEVHCTISILFSSLLPSILIEPGLSDRLVLVGVAGAPRHAERLWHCDVILAFTTFRHHILFVHQGLLQTTL